MSEEVSINSVESVNANVDFEINDTNIPGQEPETITNTNPEVDTVDTEQNINNTDDRTDFSLDDISFEDEETEVEIGEHQFGKYNLDKYADVLPFDDEEVVTELNNYASVLEEQGFNQKQVEWLLEKEIADASAIEEMTLSEVKKNLQDNLTKEELRNWKPVAKFANTLKENGLDIDVEAAMKDPAQVRMLNFFYKDKFGGNVNQKTAEKYQPKVNEIQPVEAMRRYREWAESQSEITDASKQAFVKSILENASNKEQLKELFLGTL